MTVILKLALMKDCISSDSHCIYHMFPLKILHPAPEGQLAALHGQKWTRMIRAQWRYEKEGRKGSIAERQILNLRQNLHYLCCEVISSDGKVGGYNLPLSTKSKSVSRWSNMCPLTNDTKSLLQQWGLSQESTLQKKPSACHGLASSTLPTLN